MKKILVCENPWQTRVAITRDNKLQNVYFSSHAVKRLERSFFKGIITKILPGIQTAFVEIGQEKAGFLHISEIDRMLAVKKMGDLKLEDIKQKKPTSKRTSARSSKDISKIFKEGEAVLVQVSKEPVYEKGAKLTTCFTLPGRFIVLMPNIPRIGISKKIDDREERARLKELLLKNLPDGMGAIIRTTSENRGAQEIKQDISFLVKTWKKIQKNFAEAKPEAQLHEDLDLAFQAVRDHLDDDVESVITNDKKIQKQLLSFVKGIAPEHAQKIKFYKEPPALFDKFDIEQQIDATLEKKVQLKSGGSIVIESTEAMTVIDVNTGKYTGKKDLEETILKTNLEAAEETVRQLRLRNIGGLIVIDFIDMASSANRQKLHRVFEKTLRERDKFQSVVLKVSEFGLLQMTRKRSGNTLVQQLTDNCSTCKGAGFITSPQTHVYRVLRDIQQDLLKKKPGGAYSITLNPHIFETISNIEYNSVLELERQFNCQITLESKDSLGIDKYRIKKI